MENANAILEHTVKKACCQDKPLVQTVFFHLVSRLSAFQNFHNFCAIDKLMINNLYFLFSSLLKLSECAWPGSDCFRLFSHISSCEHSSFTITLPNLRQNCREATLRFIQSSTCLFACF